LARSNSSSILFCGGIIANAVLLLLTLTFFSCSYSESYHPFLGSQKPRFQSRRGINRRVEELSPELRDRIEVLSLEELESLGEALLDFSGVIDLENWLNEERSR
jgi:hypothetical protein